LRFRTLSTEHFRIYFHQGEDRLAARLAIIAEEAWRALRQPFGAPPPPRTHVVLADQTDLANGYATPLPYNTIVVMPAWPAGVDFIGVTDDWLRIVFTHEFTHIVHFDRSRGWARGVRAILGRTELAFPNLFLPTWQIEGLATYEESVITGAGRLHAGDFGAIAGEESRRRAVQPLDRLNGGLTDWPAGLGAYAYGVGFHQYLADRFGPASLGTLADATAARVPYTTAPVFKRVFGESLGDLWREYQATLVRDMPPPPAETEITRLTRHGFVVSGPRFDRFACASCPGQIVYSVRTPDGFPALNRVALEGGAPRRVATRYLGATTAIGRDALYFDQQEVRRNAGMYSDLYAVSRAGGRVKRMTSEARLLDPDVSPDGRTLACVRDTPGQRDLVIVPVNAASTVTTLVSEPETQFNAPRWSPDGRTIAAERHRLGGLSELVLIDAATKTVRVLASDARSRIVTPAWRPDGLAVVAAIAGDNQPFDLYEVAIDGVTPPRRLTRTTGGATWPDISPDGRTMVFVGYTVEGFDLFTMPYPRSTVEAGFTTPPVEAVSSSPFDVAQGDPEALERSKGWLTDRYSPLPTLKPTSWSPVVERDTDQVRIGASVGTFDVLGYHFYGAAVTWLAASPAGAPTPSAATPDWSVYYAYERWRPTFWTTARMATSFFAGPATEAGTPAAATRREREVEGGMLFPVRHTRVSHTALASVIRAVDDYTLPDRTVTRNRTAVRGAWSTTSSHVYGYSISPEGGVAAGLTAETVRRRFGAFADATTVTADVRAYLPAFSPHHVAAVRLAAGASTGDRETVRTFHLGGALSDASVIDFGRDAISLLRGFGSNTFAGSHVALLNADYRFPIARPQRGLGTWPLFLHTIHGAVFADAGHAWTRSFDATAVKTSAGAEISVNLVAGYFFPLTATVGAARGHDGSRIVSDRTTFYVRMGRAF